MVSRFRFLSSYSRWNFAAWNCLSVFLASRKLLEFPWEGGLGIALRGCVMPLAGRPRKGGTVEPPVGEALTRYRRVALSLGAMVQYGGCEVLGLEGPEKLTGDMVSVAHWY